jgi:hypothetical protein
MIDYGTGSFSGEVEVMVHGQAERGRPVAYRLGLNQKDIVVSQSIGNRYIDRAWISLFTVRTPVSQA